MSNPPKRPFSGCFVPAVQDVPVFTTVQAFRNCRYGISEQPQDLANDAGKPELRTGDTGSLKPHLDQQ